MFMGLHSASLPYHHHRTLGILTYVNAPRLKIVLFFSLILIASLAVPNHPSQAKVTKRATTISHRLFSNKLPPIITILIQVARNDLIASYANTFLISEYQSIIETTERSENYSDHFEIGIGRMSLISETDLVARTNQSDLVPPHHTSKSA